MEDHLKNFQHRGVILLEKICAPDQAEKLYQKISENISQCALELNCNIEHYLRNVSRWVDPSPVTYSIKNWGENFFKEKLSCIMHQKVKLNKINVISKSAYAYRCVPCHQDIAYSPDHPYEFSVWLALQDVTLEDGVLEFLPGSHKESISPAVDFWKPDFIDEVRLSRKWQDNFINFPLRQGDAVLFDSRIWHRSAESRSNRNRFAIVTRWSRLDYRPPAYIPPKIHSRFGMWTCNQLTESILQSGLRNCFGVNSASDLMTCLHLWSDKIRQQDALPFVLDFDKACDTVNNLLILHQSSLYHNGGDAQGTVYSALWQHLLEPLTRWLDRPC